MVYYLILAGIILGLAQYFSERFCAKCQKYYFYIVSFSAGIGVTYVFLDLFPNFAESATGVSRYLFLSVLVGFAVFHLVEKYIYQHTHGKKLKRYCTSEEYSTSFFYHILIGMVLVTLWNTNHIQGILFFVPMIFFTIASTLPIPPPKHHWTTLVLSSSTLIGIILGILFFPFLPESVKITMLGLVLGIISFTVIRHALPIKHQGKPFFFFLGAVLYAIVIMATWAWS